MFDSALNTSDFMRSQSSSVINIICAFYLDNEIIFFIFIRAAQ